MTSGGSTDQRAIQVSPSMEELGQRRIAQWLYWSYWVLLLLSIVGFGLLSTLFYFVTFIVALVKVSDTKDLVAKSHFKNYIWVFVVSIFGFILLLFFSFFFVTNIDEIMLLFTTDSGRSSVQSNDSYGGAFALLGISWIWLIVYCIYRIIRGMLRLAEHRVYREEA